jgi:hypothetical protein
MLRYYIGGGGGGIYFQGGNNPYSPFGGAFTGGGLPVNSAGDVGISSGPVTGGKR